VYAKKNATKHQYTSANYDKLINDKKSDGRSTDDFLHFFIGMLRRQRDQWQRFCSSQHKKTRNLKQNTQLQN